MTEATTLIRRSSDALTLSFYRRPSIAPDKTIHPPAESAPNTRRRIQNLVSSVGFFFTPLTVGIQPRVYRGRQPCKEQAPWTVRRETTRGRTAAPRGHR